MSEWGALRREIAIVVPLLCLLIQLIIPSANGERIWKCSGKPTTYTYTDCETDKSLTDGCYYLVHFEQYRPCNHVCDGVEMWSIDEERCSYLCPAYLGNNCQVYEPTEKVSTMETTRAQQYPYETFKFLLTTTGTSENHPRSPWILISAILISVLILVCIIAISIILSRPKTRHFNRTCAPDIRTTTQPIQSTDKEELFEIAEWIAQSNVRDGPEEALMETNEKKIHVV